MPARTCLGNLKFKSFGSKELKRRYIAGHGPQLFGCAFLAVFSRISLMGAGERRLGAIARREARAGSEFWLFVWPDMRGLSGWEIVRRGGVSGSILEGT